MKRILIFIPLILLSACASKKPVIVEMPPAVSGTTLDTADMESVRYGENLKAYSFGRYVDPNDGLVMHEAHTVFRVETTAKWNLHPNMPANVPGGPVVGIIDPAHKDSPLTPEVVAEVVASGGLGVAGGTVFLTAGVGVVIVGVTAAVMYGFHAADEHQDNIRLSKTIEYLSSKPTFFISNAQNYGGSR